MTNAEIPAVRKLQWSKWLVMGVILVPMVVAYVIYETGLGIPTNTINKGVLLNPPVQIDSLELRDRDNQPMTMAQQPQKWRLLVPAMSACDDACVEALYITRQVHTRLNEKYTRVERVFLVADLDSATEQLIATEHANIQVVKVDPSAWAALLAQTNYAQGRYLMMDPDGFLMMYYQDQHTGNDLLADLKRMLKFSREH
ncbi:hypothetical protein QWY82_04320 [Simiduia curdlanivorans]|uniref:Transmembrane protein n=1 Tax=Simiduia curdlanivorans TaxID=1492769 RepID=A0ABV8V286_9GAMM|nr:hypothetical protein [Simiduia curdlanivorans]MDN3638031.1 hypothetical protein [Simiduia curdlanivorans]